MKHILLPTDFSENSWNAIKYAVQLFKDEVCTFHLFNAYTPVIYHVEYVLAYPAQFGLGDVVRNSSQEKLSLLIKKIRDQFGKNPNHSFETIARFDALVTGIVDLVKERHIDLIVMGTKGATGAKEILFGSNTVHVFREVKCPILAIPSDFEYEPPNEILFPTDLEVSYTKSQLNIFRELVVLHASCVHEMHVSSGYELTEAQNNNKRQLDALFESAFCKFHEVKDMEISNAITQFQEGHKINLLVMVNNKHSFFENLFFNNTINQIGFYLKIPFLVIPSK